MSVLRYLFFYILLFFIKIGDAIIFILQKISFFYHQIQLSISQFYAFFFPFKKKKKGIARKKDLYVSTTRKPKGFVITLQVLQKISSSCTSFLLFIMQIPKKIVDGVRRSLAFIGGIFSFKKKKKRGRPSRKGLYRPSFFYKAKYVLLGSFLSFVFVFAPLLFYFFVTELPNPDNLSLNYIPQTTKLYDRNGNLLYEIYANQNRTVVKLQHIPKSLQHATIAIEDKDFYTHPGFDIRGIARAALVDLKQEGFQGGSTITQQLIKSAFLTPEPTIIRKVKEVVLAFWAERVYTKDQILEMYFNYVPYGGTAWGVQSASEVYFGKDVSDLTLAEAAFLAGLPRAPSIYSPYSGVKGTWKVRQKDVLDAMVRQGYISQEQAKIAYAEELTFQKPAIPLKAPHFVMYVKNLLVEKYGLSEVEHGGLQVITTLDLSVQEKTQEKVTQHVEANEHLNLHNGAAVVTNPKTGDILAMVGSRNYFDEEHEGNVNLTTALRQPGSTVKVITYALALSSGMTEASLVDDTPFSIVNPDGSVYAPVNYDGRFHGRVPLRIALANSFNIPAVRLTQQYGVEKMVKLGKEMGVSSWGNANKYGLAITLGSGEATMLDMATVFGTLANHGTRVDLDPILEVRNAHGKLLYKKEGKKKEVLSPGVSFIISDILADNNARSIEFGTNSPLHIPEHRVSVKTGTSDNKRDNWTIGYTPSYVVATWVGNNDNSPMSQALASGITGAAPMWHDIISQLIEGSQEKVEIPSDVVKQHCFGREMYFIKGTVPANRCNYSPAITPFPSFSR